MAPVSFWHPGHSLSTFLHKMLILCSLVSSPRISHFSKEPWFLLVDRWRYLETKFSLFIVSEVSLLLAPFSIHSYAINIYAYLHKHNTKTHVCICILHCIFILPAITFLLFKFLSTFSPFHVYKWWRTWYPWCGFLFDKWIYLHVQCDYSFKYIGHLLCQPSLYLSVHEQGYHSCSPSPSSLPPYSRPLPTLPLKEQKEKVKNVF